MKNLCELYLNGLFSKLNGLFLYLVLCCRGIFFKPQMKKLNVNKHIHIKLVCKNKKENKIEKFWAGYNKVCVKNVLTQC